jgi:hypothetical protein
MNNLIKDLRRNDYKSDYDGSAFLNDHYLKPLRALNENYRALTVESKALLGDKVANIVNDFSDLVDEISSKTFHLLIYLDDIEDITRSIKDTKICIKNGNLDHNGKLKDLEKMYK